MQECIKQHEFLKSFNEDSVNIFRIITYRNEGKIDVLSCSLRFGKKGSTTDITRKDGKEIANVVGINKDGFLKTTIVGFDGIKRVDKRMAQMRVPKWKELQQLAKDGHSKLFYFDIVGWDFTIDYMDNIVCIEYNIVWPGNILYQFVNGPFAGKDTEDFLSRLKYKEIKKAIPNCIRIK